MRTSLQAWIFALVLFVATLFFFTRGNGFPFYAHPDEPWKVRQVQEGRWNFHHPMLMLSTARAVALATTTEESLADKQRVVEIGRWISASFCAGAVVLLAMMVWMIAGPYAAMITGALMISNRQFFELAHYFKEDTALLFGVAAWFFALTVYLKKPSVKTVALVGVGAGLALSGKFLGVFTVVLSLALVPLGIARGGRGRALGLFLAGVAGTYVLCNLPVFLNFSSALEAFNSEVRMVVEGQRGTTRSVPHDVYFTAFQKNITFLLWIPLFWYYSRCWKKRHRLTLLDWTVTLFPIVYLLLLSFSPKTHDRYFFPATALFLCGVGMGMNRLCRRWPQAPPSWLPVVTVRRLSKIWPRRISVWAAMLAVVLVQFFELRDYYQAFRKDDLKDLTVWLNENLPDAVLAIDRKVMLPSERYKDYHPWQPPVKAAIVKRDIERFNDLEELRAEGVTHVVLSESSYGRYQSDKLRPQKGAEDRFLRRKMLYDSIWQSNRPLWRRSRSIVTYLHPGLEVYKLPPAVE